jgi:2,3-bisphosphoglycerate-independent phosphoglycerate mutase
LDLNLMRELSVRTESKIVLLVLDGLGGLPGPAGKTELEAASTPNLDALAARSELGLIRPVAAGVSPGSGPGHLSLFGYDPLQHPVGRGVLSALGVGFELEDTDLAARINFATMSETGEITDRRAGRIPSELGSELAALLNEKVDLSPVETFVVPEKEHRAVVVFRAEDLSDALSDTDPQQTGKKPLPVRPTDPDSQKARRSAELANAFVQQANEILSDRHPANTVLLRGFGMHPALPKFDEVYRLRAAAIASYPMYKGLARLAGMEVLQEGEGIAGEIRTLRESWEGYDFFFVHIKPTDSAGEDGDFERKARVIEEVDALIPEILEAGPAAFAVTGDHSTPAALRSHSWHPVPFLLHSRWAVPTAGGFGERACAGGVLGTFPAEEVMGLLMGHALKLNRYGA